MQKEGEKPIQQLRSNTQFHSTQKGNDMNTSPQIGVSAEPLPRWPREIERLLAENAKVATVGCLGSLLAAPTSDPGELFQQFQIRPDCRWSLQLGQIVTLEYNPQIGRYALAHLCSQDWDEWPETLQYRWGSSLYLLFRSEARRMRSVKTSMHRKPAGEG
jgi:hypothetical protein